MTKNPYLEHIRKEAYREKQDWMNRAADMAEDDGEITRYDTELAQEEVEDIAEETYQKFKDSCYFADERVDSLPQLLTTLNELASEWRTMSNNRKSDNDEGDSIRWGMYSHMSTVAYDEAEKVEFILEEYLL